MTPEKDILLRQRYPKIFGSPEMKNDAVEMWGFECDDGWFDLLNTLCEKIQSHIDYRSKYIQDAEELSGLQVIAQQVKEKFGGLRFYAVGGDDTTNAYIDLAEAMSLKVCETCGNPGKQQGERGWIHTACDPCFEKRAWRKTP